MATGGADPATAYGTEGFPTPSNPMMALAMQMILPGIMPKGFSLMGQNDLNAYDFLQRQRVFKWNWEFQQRAAQLDKASYAATASGLMRLGIPGSPAADASAGEIGKFMSTVGPMLDMVMPGWEDTLAGPKGSASVMGRNMFAASRQRYDPVTGGLGQDPDSVWEQVRARYQSVEAGGLAATGGFTMGRFGEMYRDLGRRGLLAADISSPVDRAAKIAGRDPSKMTPTEIDKLVTDSGPQLRAVDAQKVDDSLKKYTAAVSAVRDIFGDMGRPNAPMAELLNALEALTSGQMRQIDPGRLDNMVRTTYSLAANTVGIDNAMVMQAHFAQRASQFGLPPSVAIAANQQALATYGMWQRGGYSAAWGAPTAEQMSQLMGNLTVSAAASPAASRMNLALRLDDLSGGFVKGGSAAAYVTALKTASETGATTWVDPATGRTRNLNLGSKEFSDLLVGTGHYTAAEVQAQLTARENQEFGVRFDTATTVQHQQRGSDIARGRFGAATGATLQRTIAERLVAASNGTLSQPAAQRMAAGALTGEKVAGFVQGVLDIPIEELNGKERNVRIGEELRKALAGSEAGKILDTAAAHDPRLRREIAGMLDLDTNANRSGFGSLAGMAGLFGTTATARTRRDLTEARLRGQIESAATGLNRGGLISKFLGALQEVPEGPPGEQDPLVGVIGSTLGVKQEDVRRDLLPKMRDFAARKTDLEKQLQDAMNSPAGPARDEKIKQLTSGIGAYRTQLHALDAALGATAFDPSKPDDKPDEAAASDFMSVFGMKSTVGGVRSISKAFMAPGGKMMRTNLELDEATLGRIATRAGYKGDGRSNVETLYREYQAVQAGDENGRERFQHKLGLSRSQWDDFEARLKEQERFGLLGKGSRDPNTAGDIIGKALEQGEHGGKVPEVALKDGTTLKLGGTVKLDSKGNLDFSGATAETATSSAGPNYAVNGASA